MQRRLPVLLPLAILLLGLLGMMGLRSLRADPQRSSRPVVVPAVRTAVLRVEPQRYLVHSQGTVSPRTSSRLVAEVAGRVIHVAPNFVAGAFVARGDTLLTLDDRDYRAALANAQAQLAAARLRMALAEQEHEVAQEEWKSFDGGTPDPLVLRQPQLEEARAAVQANEAMVEKARRDLSRTRLRAPYDGRIQTKLADQGDFLAPGAAAAALYAVDFAEVRLPLPDRELVYLDLPLGYHVDDRGPGLRVRLSSDFAQHQQNWDGFVHRTEGEIDPLTRMVHLVARVEDPYGRRHSANTPLAVGMFVEAEISGREVLGASIPTAALRPNSQVWIVDADDRIEIRDVQVLRRGGDHSILGDGVTDGERICLTPLTTVVDGMDVSPVADEGSPQ